MSRIPGHVRPAPTPTCVSPARLLRDSSLVQETGPWLRSAYPAATTMSSPSGRSPAIALHAERKDKGKEKAKGNDQATFPQRESVLFALRELTGQDAGNESAAWKDATRPRPPAE